MKNPRFGFASLLLLLAASASAHATSYSFGTSQAFSFSPTVTSAGTVSVVDDGKNKDGTSSVTVTVTLGKDFSFRKNPDDQHTGFVFELDSSLTGVTASQIVGGASSTFVFEGKGSYNETPYGSWNYALICSSCSKGAPTTPVETLSFVLTGTGLTSTSFVSNNGHYFGADLVGLDSAAGGSGNTGAVVTGGAILLKPLTVTPEPSSLLLLGTGITGLAAAVRRQASRAALKAS